MRRSLWQTLLLLFLGVFLCSVVTLSYLVYHTSHEALLNEFKIRGKELTKAIASESQTYYQKNDLEGFTSLLQSLGEAEGVLAILAYDRAKVLWIESSAIELMERELILIPKGNAWQRDWSLETGTLVSEFGKSVAPDHRVGTPIANIHAPFGWIRILLDRSALEERMETLLIRILSFSGMIALFGGMVFVWLLQKSLKTVGPLTEATRKIAQGDLTTTVPVMSQDELGELAVCFNDMTDQLHKTTVSKQYVDTIIGSLIETLIVVDPEGCIQIVNQSAVQLLGYPESQLIGQSMVNIFPQGECPLKWDAPQPFWQEGFGHRETTYLTKNGTRIPVLFSAAAMYDHEGTHQGFACVAYDIAQRKQAETHLTLSLGLLHAIDQAQAQFIAAGDPHATFHELLVSLLSLTGSDIGFIGERLVTTEGQPYLKTHAISNIAWDEETRAQFTAQGPNLEFFNLQTLFGETLITGEPVLSNQPTHDPRSGGLPHGHPPLTSFLGLPFFSGQQLVGMVGLANRPGGFDEEIIHFLQPLLSTCGNLIEAYRNEQRRASVETALRKSVERFDIAVRGSQDGLWDAWAVSTDWLNSQHPVYYSPRFKELLGFQDHEFANVVGSWSSRLYPEDRDRALQALVDHLEKNIPYDIEYRMITKQGEVRWFAGRGQAMRNEQGRPVRMSGSFGDITERKRKDEELRKANEQLRELDRLRTQFYADISHELRTPLTVIRGEAEVTLRGRDKPLSEYKTTLGRIVLATKEVNKLVEDLLFLSRSEAGAIRIHQQPFALEPLLQECIHAGEVLCEPKHIIFQAHHGQNQLINGDQQRLKQAIMILIDNAVKYTESGGSIALRHLIDQTEVSIIIRDTGLGIAEENLPHIFDRFYRVKRPHPDIPGGAGLGLPIAKWIIDAHQGNITVDSRLGQGTTVTIILPLHLPQ